MFDEADHFMDADTRDDYPQLSRLKELMEDTGRAFKVVFAGLHNVQRMHRQPNSPLAHLGQPICIGPLNRRSEQSQFLVAWGAEMVRVHLHQIELTDPDTPPLRSAILNATGGIPTEVVKLIKEMRIADDPTEVAQDWQAKLRVPRAILKDRLALALVVLDLSDGEAYEAFNDLMKEHTGSDLEDIGPDLVATGLVSTWKPKAGLIRRSALGDLLS